MDVKEKQPVGFVSQDFIVYWFLLKMFLKKEQRDFSKGSRRGFIT